jgi:ribosomal protein S18 acetylase RimI-like enzyme
MGLARSPTPKRGRHALITSIHDLEPQLANLRSYWLGWGSPDHVDDDMPVFRTDLPHPLLNGVLRVRGLSVEDALTEAQRRLAGTPSLWRVGPDSDPGLVEQLVAHGGQVRSTLPVMAVDLTRVAAVEVPGLRITRVVDRPATTEYVEAYSDVFSVPTEALSAFVDAEVGYDTAHSEVERFAGSLDGQVVGTAQLSISHGVAGIYWVGVAKPCRGRGIGAALTVAALLAGRERGLRIGTLQASSMGEPVYRGIGFETVGHLHHVTV